MSTSCNGCKYWSEMVAEAIGGGPVMAMCLHSKNDHKPPQMTYEGCNDFEEGEPIDLPGCDRILE